MKTVLDHPIVAEGDVTQLRSFYNTLHNAVATMKSGHWDTLMTWHLRLTHVLRYRNYLTR